MIQIKNSFVGKDIYFIWMLATIALAILLFDAQIFHILHYPIWRDDATFDMVAKNLANGVGYEAVFFDKSYPFHRVISSGPLIILPAAVLMFFFGNQYWVSGVSNILLIWSLLIGIFILADGFVGKKRKWPFCFLSLLLTLLFSIDLYGNEYSDRLILWHLLMGEVPAVLCVIIATLLLFHPQFSVRKILLGGLFLGLAIMGKTIVSIAVIVIAAVVSLRIVRNKNLKKLDQVYIISGLVFCIAAPFCLFDLVKIISLGWLEYLKLKKESAEIYKLTAVATSSIFENIRLHAIYLLNTFNFAGYVLILVTFYFIYLSFITKKNTSQHCRWAAIALILCFTAHVCWWVGFSTGSDRHLMPAFTYYFFGLSLLLITLDYQKLSRFSKIIIYLFIFLLVASREDASNYLISAGFKGNDKKLQEQLVVVEAVKNLQEQGVTMIACGNNFELEYLLPNSRNFKKCEELLHEDHDRPILLVSYLLNYNRVLTLGHDWKGGVFEYIPQAIAAKCSHEYLRTENYSLNWCR